MQKKNSSSSNSVPLKPEAIIDWLHKEMGYRPLGPYSTSTSGGGGNVSGSASSNVGSVPNVDSIRKICRGNMIPVWEFLIKRVKSEKTVERIRKNIVVHGGDGSGGGGGVGRKKEKVGGESGARDAALEEREAAAKEVERLRSVVRRQRKELKARMVEVSREEAERKRMLDERAKNRF